MSHSIGGIQIPGATASFVQITKQANEQIVTAMIKEVIKAFEKY
ncbi:hypothetical protein [Bacillus sp. Marseille-P3661]|nr:hypothetical protein [Bacillus sp. Marseille-P3661]